MRRVLLFLLLAGAGLAGLSLAAGGFLGVSHDTAKPEVPVITEPVAQTGDRERVRISDFPAASHGTRPPDFQLQAAKSVSGTVNHEHTWVDPVTRERIVFPFYPELSYVVEDPVPYRDPSSGTPGGHWHGWKLTVYRDVASLTRKEAEALRSAPQERQRLVLYEITAAEGTASFPVVPVAEGQHAPGARTIVHLTKDVVIRIVPEAMTIRTSEVTIDKEAGTAEGPGDIEAENSSLKLKGRGFRLDRTARRLEILEGVWMDARPLAADPGSPATFDLGTGPFRPKTLRCRDRAVVAQRDDGDGVPFYEITLTDQVRVEAEDGSRLDANEVVLNAIRRPLRRSGGDGGPAPEGSKWKLSRMVADGNVLAESHEKPSGAGSPAPVLSIATTRMTSYFEGNRLEGAVLEGATTVRYLGALQLPGGRGRVGSVVATCRERLTYGPRLATAPEIPPCDAVLELVGHALVEGAAAPGEEPQRLQADRLQLYLRRPPRAAADDGSSGTAGPVREGGPELSQMQAVGFLATGTEVRITGPRLNALAQEMHGFDLHQESWRVLASGRDVRLEVAEEATADDPKAKAGRPRDGKEPAPHDRARSWGLEGLEARQDVTGSLRPQPGEGAFTFTADELSYVAATGGELRSLGERRATVGRPRPDGRGDLIQARVVTFRLEPDERRLMATGGVDAVIWTAPAVTSAARPATGRSTIAITSGSEIEFRGGRDAAKHPTIAVKAHDGAAVESRRAGLTADRVAAGEITASLVDRPGAGPGALLGSGPASTRRGPADVPPTGRAAPKGAAPGARWSVRCDSLEVALGDAAVAGAGLGGLRRLEALGKVDARTEGSAGALDRQRFEGERLAVDGVAGTGVLAGSPAARARVTMGDEAVPQRLVSPAIDFTLEAGTLSRAVFSAPVAGVFHGSPTAKKAGDPAAPLERYVLRAESGDLVVDARGAVVTGTPGDPVVVTRSTRAPGARDFERGLTLVTPRLTLSSAGGLGHGAMTLDRLVADGLGTRVEMGDPAKDFTRAMGDHLEYVRATSILRLTGRDGVSMTRPGFRGKVRAFMFDTATNTPDVEGADFVLEVSK